MTPQSLKSAILQLAIQGKLVPQRPEDGVARVPAALNTEKRKARRHGEEMEAPFDIPESWRWVHLNQIATSGLGKTLDKAKDTGVLCPYLCSINVYWNGISLEKVKTAKFSEEEKYKYRLEKGDLLICEGGDVGRAAIWNSDTEMYYQNALHRVRFHGDSCPAFFKYAIECYKGIGLLDEYSKGMTIKHLVQKSLYAMPFPLPPLPEQHRIVAKIEELLPLVDRYEQAWTKLEDFNRRFPADMQKSLLQLAIQGQLVEQRPEEGTGEQLYRKILATKTTKKDKKLPPIADDEIPFEIPESWKWVRFGELGVLKSGYAFKSSEYTSDGLQVVRISDLGDDSIGSKDAVYYPRQDELSSYFVVNGSFLICMTGSIGKMAWVKDGVLRYLNQRVGMFVPNALCFPAYLWYFIHTNHVINGWIRAKTSANGNIKNSDITDLLTPLPPLAEQKRIVAKLEELLPQCDTLDQSI